jgi:fumarate reductase flavoprotein subunit
MAEEAGAAVTRRGFFLPIMGLIPDPDRPGYAVDYRRAFVELAPAYRTPHEIWVNNSGRRFVAEDGGSPELRERALLQQPWVTMHVVFDRAGARAAAVPLIRNGAGDWTREAFLRTCDASPWVTRADTVEGLATRLGAEPGTLRTTLDAYNAAVDAGQDEAFGRTVLPGRIERPPFYAVTSIAASILSRDGLRVDTKLAVLDTAGRAIPGLYAVGEILGNNAFAGDSYVGGMSVTPAMTLGRLLGSRLARCVDGSPS